jgi:hypothetical protein
MIVDSMNQLEQLEEIVKMGKDISNSKGRDIFLYYLRQMRSTKFDKEKFELLMLKYNIMKKEYLEVLNLLEKREVIDLLITTILHPN